MPNDSRNRVVVHIGLPKTGTTFLQNHVFRACPQIADFGKTPWYRVERPEVYDALRAIAMSPDEEFRSRQCAIRTLLMREAERSLSDNPGSSHPLLSYEGFYRPKAMHPVDIYGRLESIFGPVRVLLTIREQFEWLTSFYLYKFYNFLDGGAPPFETWASQRRKRVGWNVFTCCDYWAVTEQLVRRAGEGNVLVEPMEGLVKERDRAAVKRLAAFLAVDGDVLARLFEQAEPTKQRIDDLGFLLGRVLYESRAATLSDEELLELKRTFRKIHEELKDSRDGAQVPREVVERSFSDAERAAIRQGNAALAKYINQDLARFGYSCA